MKKENLFRLFSAAAFFLILLNYPVSSYADDLNKVDESMSPHGGAAPSEPVEIGIVDGPFGVPVYHGMSRGVVNTPGLVYAPVKSVKLPDEEAVKLALSATGMISVGIKNNGASKVSDIKGKPVSERVKETGTPENPAPGVLLEEEDLTDVFRQVINLDGELVADRWFRQGCVIKLVSNEDIDVE